MRNPKAEPNHPMGAKITFACRIGVLRNILFEKSSQRQTNKNDNPEQWNKEWEGFLSQSDRVRKQHDNLKCMTTGTITQSEIALLDEWKTLLSCIQYKLNQIHCAAWMDGIWPFDLTWLNHSPETRQKIMLQGLVLASKTYEMDRIFCPDITLSHLEQTSGQRFLEYFMAVSPGLNKAPKGIADPVFVSLPAEFSSFKQGPSSNDNCALLFRIALRRGLFLSEFLLQTMGVFLKIGPLTIHRLPRHDMQDTFGESMADRLSSNGMIKDLADILQATAQAAYRKYPRTCCRPLCAVTERELSSKFSNSRRLMHCIKCAEYGRNHPYCSRECQKQDWTRHKLLCGKAYTLPPGVVEVPVEHYKRSYPAFPAPRPGFVRPDALVEQISALCYLNSPAVKLLDGIEERPGYLIRLSKNKSHVILEKAQIMLLHDLFHAIRDYAFLSGNEDAILWLCREILLVTKEKKSTIFQNVVDQLSTEFAIDPELLINAADIGYPIDKLTGVLNEILLNTSADQQKIQAMLDRYLNEAGVLVTMPL